MPENEAYQETRSGWSSRVDPAIAVQYCSFRSVVVGDEEHSFRSSKLCSTTGDTISELYNQITFVHSRISKDMIAALKNIRHVECFFWVDRFERSTQNIRLGALVFVLRLFCKFIVGVCQVIISLHTDRRENKDSLTLKQRSHSLDFFGIHLPQRLIQNRATSKGFGSFTIGQCRR